MVTATQIPNPVMAAIILGEQEIDHLRHAMPEANPQAIQYWISDPYGSLEWAEMLTRLEPGFRPSEAPGTHTWWDKKGKRQTQHVRQTHWDLPVEDGWREPTSTAVGFLPMLDEHNRSIGYVARRPARHQGNLPPAYLPSGESDDQPEGLDELDSFQAVNAERRRNAKGPESTQRARVMASVLGVDSEALGKYVHGLLRKTPQANRWSHQEELESAIYTMLYKGREWAGGSMERCQVVASGAYKDWYSLYSNHAQLGVEAVNRSISLERHYASERQDAEAVGHDLGDSAWVGWEEAVVDNADAWWAMAALPAEIQVVVERKANGVPITGNERKRLTRFLAGGPTKRSPNLPTNKDILASIMAGTHLGPVRWNKPKR